MSLNLMCLLHQPSDMRLLDRTVFWIQMLCGLSNNVFVSETNILYTALYNGDLNTLRVSAVYYSRRQASCFRLHKE